MELDHVFICTAADAPAADALIRLGFVEGSPNQHPGQGTANRRFFFRHAFIELLYPTREAELLRVTTHRTRLHERLLRSDSGASPFGVCLRPSPGEDGAVPFPSWDYTPDYLPAGRSIPVGHAPLAEPMWFVLPFATRPERTPESSPEPVDHTCGVTQITALRIAVPGEGAWSEAARYVNEHVDSVQGVRGEAPVLHVTFDDGRGSRTHDLRPDLPLRLTW